MEPVDKQLTTTCPTTAIVGGISGGGATASTAISLLSPTSPGETQTGSMVTSKEDEEDSSLAASSDGKSPGQRYVNFLITLNFWYLNLFKKKKLFINLIV